MLLSNRNKARRGAANRRAQDSVAARVLSQARDAREFSRSAPARVKIEDKGETKMKRRFLMLASALALAVFLTAGATAQTTSAQSAMDGAKRPVTRIIVMGDSIVHAQPDTAILGISVVTQSKRAIDAQADNANKSDAVIRAVKAAAGAGAEVKTSGYVLEPQRVYRENQPPTITGYEARNTVTVTMSDLTKVGAVIDAASQAGANNIESVSFTLRKDQAARDEALTQATREAMRKAQAIAQALGGRVTRVVEVQEGSATIRPVYQAEYGVVTARAAPAKPTPIEVGTLDIASQVQLVAEVETPQ